MSHVLGAAIKWHTQVDMQNLDIAELQLAAAVGAYMEVDE
jgi:hypothetical protein